MIREIEPVAIFGTWKFFRMVDKGNLTSGNFQKNMGRCKIVKKNLVVTWNEEEQVSPPFSLRD